MTKYKEYVARMLEANKSLFNEFKGVHARYGLDQDGCQAEFNKVGEQVLAAVREWENKLCRQTESAGYGSYTVGLAEKFQTEIKKTFPLIDHIGLKSPTPIKKDEFILKRIIL